MRIIKRKDRFVHEGFMGCSTFVTGNCLLGLVQLKFVICLEISAEDCCTRMYQHKVALCMFRSEVTWPDCTEKDKRISW